ncbi:MAG: hypothetical protein AB7I27_18025 [Bacteriovoracaceae bacterium]
MQKFFFLLTIILVLGSVFDTRFSLLANITEAAEASQEFESVEDPLLNELSIQKITHPQIVLSQTLLVFPESVLIHPQILASKIFKPPSV